MRRFMPWLLLGVLGLVTGLGLGLGLAYGGSYGARPRIAAPRLVQLVPTWVPPGNVESTHVVSLFYAVPDHCRTIVPRAVLAPDGSQSFSYLTTNCPLGIRGATNSVNVDGRRVTVSGIAPAHGAVVAVWHERPGTYVEVGGANVTEAQMERFIAGLRVSRMPDRVPPVVGDPEPIAQGLVGQAGLVSTVRTVTRTTGQSGTVLSQRPAAGTRVAQGSTVRLVVSSGVPGQPVP